MKEIECLPKVHCSVSFVAEGVDGGGEFVRGGIHRDLEQNFTELVDRFSWRLDALEQEFAFGLTELARHGSQRIPFGGGGGVLCQFHGIEGIHRFQIARLILREHAVQRRYRLLATSATHAGRSQMFIEVSGGGVVHFEEELGQKLSQEQMRLRRKFNRSAEIL